MQNGSTRSLNGGGRAASNAGDADANDAEGVGDRSPSSLAAPPDDDSRPSSGEGGNRNGGGTDDPSPSGRKGCASAGTPSNNENTRDERGARGSLDGAPVRADRQERYVGLARDRAGRLPPLVADTASGDTGPGALSPPIIPTIAARLSENQRQSLGSGSDIAVPELSVSLATPPPSPTCQGGSSSETTLRESENSVARFSIWDSGAGNHNVSVLLQGYVVSEEGIYRGGQTPPAAQVQLDEVSLYDGVVVPTDAEESASVGLQQSSSGRHRKKIVAAVFFSALVIAGGALTAVKTTSSDHSADGRAILTDPFGPLPSTSPVSERFIYIQSMLSPVPNHTALALEDPSSPQHRALVWLVEEDDRRLDWWNVEELMQRFALAALFFATGGEESWIENCNFLSDEHVCNWNIPRRIPGNAELGISFKGVMCRYDNTTVDALLITENNLTGVLPEEISILAGLEYVGLWKNELGGPIPSTLGLLRNLQILRLEENILSGAIPPSLGIASKMQTLLLHLNALTGIIPASLRRLSNLKHLWLGFNQLTGCVPNELNSLFELETLHLSSNSLSGNLPFIAGSFRNLRYLGLDENFLAGSIPETIFTYQNLVAIEFWGNALSGTVSSQISNLTNLEVLEVTYNSLSGVIPLSLTHLSKLYWLSLGGNMLWGTILPEIGNLSNLQMISLNANHFAGTVPDSVGDLVALEELLLSDNLLSGTVPQSLVELKSLSVLMLDNNRFVGDLSFLCDSPFTLLTADCYGDNPEVSCECCNGCCSDDLGPIGPVFGCFPP